MPPGHGAANWGGFPGLVLMMVTPPGCFLTPLILFYGAVNIVHRFLGWD